MPPQNPDDESLKELADALKELTELQKEIDASAHDTVKNVRALVDHRAEYTPVRAADYPDHDHEKDGQEEVYFVVEGSVTIQAGDEAFELMPGTFARVGPGQKRKLVPGDDGVTLLALGGKPGSFEAHV